MIVVFILFELSYDKFHENADRIYRMVIQYKSRQGKIAYSLTQPGPFVEKLKTEQPEILERTRIFSYSWREKAIIRNGDINFYEKNLFLADPSIFKVFSFPFVNGDVNLVFNKQNGIVITESAAKKYFGDQYPIGKILTISHVNTYDFEVTGVIKDIPSNSHFKPEFIASLNACTLLYWGDLVNSDGFNFYTYFLLSKNANPVLLEKKINDNIKMYLENFESTDKIFLQPLKDIHLHSKYSGEFETNGNIDLVYLLSFLAAIILLIACFNFINLSIAKSIMRVKEIGIRKVVGANRIQLIAQFIGEALLFTLISLPLALLAAELFLPAFNNLLMKELKLGLHNFPLLLILLLLTIVTGLISGSYPAFFISRTKPALAVKNKSPIGYKKTFFRNILVICQFSISIMLIICTIIVSNQMKYINNKKLGFQKDRILVIPLKDDYAAKKQEILKSEFLSDPWIKSVSASRYLPSRITGKHRILYDGINDEDNIWINYNDVDYDFLKTFEITLSEGRDFSKEFPSDEQEAYIVNEQAVKQFGWDSGPGKYFQLSNKGLMRANYTRGSIIGVVRDFHFRSLRSKIEPVILTISKTGYAKYLSIKINSEKTNIETILGFLENKWYKIVPSSPFEFFFFDEEFQRMYESERRTNDIFKYSAVFSILIACLGLFGLISYIAEKRTKEVGIRKVLGAKSLNIVTLLSKQFIFLVTVSNLLAWPAAYFIMNKWLANFAYKAGLSIATFLLSGILSFLIALVTISYRAVKAASTNPIKSLKYE